MIKYTTEVASLELPSYIRIIRSHYQDPYEPVSISLFGSATASSWTMLKFPFSVGDHLPSSIFGGDTLCSFMEFPHQQWSIYSIGQLGVVFLYRKIAMVYVMETLVDSKSFEVFVEYQFGFIYRSSTQVSGKSLHEAVVSLGLTRCLKGRGSFFSLTWHVKKRRKRCFGDLVTTFFWGAEMLLGVQAFGNELHESSSGWWVF